MLNEKEHQGSYRVLFLFSIGLFAVLGVPSWIDLNGIYLQLPILLDVLPEGYSLPAYISISVQIANIFPVIYVYLFSGKNVKTVLGSLFICSLFVSIFATLFWDWVVNDHSVGLLLVSFFSGALGSMYMVTLFPFASRFTPLHISAVSVGISLSGLLPIIIAIPQQPGSDSPQFGVGTYFSILSFVVCISLIVYGVVLGFFSPLLTAHKDKIAEEEEIMEREFEDDLFEETAPLCEPGQSPEELHTKPSPEFPSLSDPLPTNAFQLFAQYWWEPLLPYFATLAWVNFLKYWLLGMYTYSVVCYQNGSSIIFWMNVGSFSGETIGRSLCAFFPSSRRVLNVLVFLQSLLFLFVIICVFYGTGPLLPAPSGGWVLVAFFSLYTLAFGYACTMHFILSPPLVNSEFPGAPHNAAERACQHLGAANQAGALLGSLLSFFIVQYSFSDFECGQTS
mmetsp:Transcript_44007/g.61859  ORF Transcript_44007/g.61859 Transcript_44007/m.61859 type:complete len:450 (+) Transcript_44007:147-1496(+)